MQLATYSPTEYLEIFTIGKHSLQLGLSFLIRTFTQYIFNTSAVSLFVNNNLNFESELVFDSEYSSNNKGYSRY